MHQTGLDLNIVWTHKENLSTSDQHQVTVAYQELIQKFFMLLEIPYEWKVHICHTGSSNTFRSSVERENWSREAPSDRRGRQACFFSAMDPLEEALPDFKKFSHKETLNDAPRTFKKDQILMQCTHLTWTSHRTEDWKIIKPAALRLFCITPCHQKHWWEFWNYTNEFGDRNSIRCETTASHGNCTHMQFYWNRRPSPATHGISAGRRPCDHIWKQHRETRCVITVTKNKSFVLISEYKEDQVQLRDEED